MQLQKARRHRDSAVDWNERAKTFTSKDYPNPYVNSFLSAQESLPRKACSTWAVGRVLSPCRSGKRGMLSWPPTSRKECFPSFAGNLRHMWIKSVHCEQMSWEDDWEEHGIAPKSHDVCTASRSIAVDDMRAAL